MLYGVEGPSPHASRAMSLLQHPLEEGYAGVPHTVWGAMQGTPHRVTLLLEEVVCMHTMLCSYTACSLQGVCTA